MILRAIGTGGNKEYLENFLDENYVGLNFGIDYNLKKFKDKNELYDELQKLYPDNKKGTIISRSSMLIKFKQQIQKGDFVCMYDNNSRKYYLGTIESDYLFDDSFITKHARKIKRLGFIERDLLSTDSKNSLGGISSLFRPANFVISELQQKLNKKSEDVYKEKEIAEEENVEKSNDFGKDYITELSKQYIGDKLDKLDPYPMQDLVAGLLRAIGYKTEVSPPGPDGGIDIYATKDGLGFEDPTIIVEVKHRKNTIGREDIQKLVGAMTQKSGSKGMFVSTGGFTKQAIDYAKTTNLHIVLVDRTYFVELILLNYEKFDDEARRLLPLARLYWPE